MNIRYKKFLIVFAVIVLFLGAYSYLSREDRAQAALGASPSSDISSTVTSTYSSSDDKISSDTAFLTSLTSLTKITIDTSLFDNQSFKLLKDNNVKLDPVVSGRPNPFLPIDASTPLTQATIMPVMTNNASQVTTKSAVLSGIINSASGATGAYFEYGTTPSLGTSTAEAKQSLVGTFVMNLTNLSPKTTYFFRAAATVNKAVSYGDVLSFTTN